MGWKPILKQAGWANPWSHQDRPTDRPRHSRKSPVIRGSGCRNTPRNQPRLEERSFLCVTRFWRLFSAWPVTAECGIVIRVDEPAPLPCLRPPAQTRKSSRCASLSRCPVCGCRCVFSQRLFGVFTWNTSVLKPSRAVKVGRTCLRGEDLWTMRWVKRLQSLHLERVSRLQFLSWLLVWQKTTV